MSPTRRPTTRSSGRRPEPVLHIPTRLGRAGTFSSARSSSAISASLSPEAKIASPADILRTGNRSTAAGR